MTQALSRADQPNGQQPTRVAVVSAAAAAARRAAGAVSFSSFVLVRVSAFMRTSVCARVCLRAWARARVYLCMVLQGMVGSLLVCLPARYDRKGGARKDGADVCGSLCVRVCAVPS